MHSPMSFNENAYLINGEPVWLASGEMHYFKMPRGDWRRRLLQLKLAGFNAVSVYMPWNYHEVTEGAWDFSGEKDVRHFLELAAEFGLYVVARPGPYICDEWQSGGIPPWLSAKRGVRLRTADPLYLSYCDRWWDQIVPIIAEYQLGKKGTVILAQVENEYGHFGDFQEEAYIHHLRDGLRVRGVDVPIITCDSFIRFARLQPRKWDGINLCCNFGGDALRNLARARELQPDAPLFVTEYWIAAFDWWGRAGSAIYDDARALNGALAIAAGGAGGLTAFVFSGGAHFAYWHGCSICSDDNFMTTLYGPGAPILDDGSFSGKYALMKAAMTGLTSCSTELAQACMPTITDNGDHLMKTVRTGPHAQFTFYQNQSKEAVTLADREKEQAAVDFAIPAGAVVWSVRNLPITDGFTLTETNANLFCSDPGLVLFSDQGKRVTVQLKCPGQPVVIAEAPGFLATVAGDILALEAVTPPTGEMISAAIRVGDQRLTVVLVNAETIARCWRIDLPGAPVTVLCGLERIEDVSVEEGGLRCTLSSAISQATWTLSGSGLQRHDVTYQGSAEACELPLTTFAVCATFPEAAADFDDQTWFTADQPKPMAHFSHGQGRAWYRTKFNVKDAGPQTIQFSGAADRALVFVDGKFLATRGVRTSCGWHIMPSLSSGEHTLAVLIENLGMFNSGAEFDVPLGEPKGLYGPVWLNGDEITGWHMQAGLRAEEQLEYWPEIATDIPWENDAVDVQKGPCWLRAAFTLPAGFDGAVRLNLATAGKGSVWLNGRNVGRYWKIGPQQSLWLPLSWLRESNTLVFFEEMEIDLSKVSVSLQPFGMTGEMIL